MSKEAEKPTQKPQADGKKKPAKPEDEFSPEDLKLKNDLEQYVNTIVSFTDEQLTDAQLLEQKTAIDSIATEMRESTTSMTAIPKPLKFLRQHIPTLLHYYDSRIAAKINATESITAMGDESGLIIPTLTTGQQLTSKEWPNKPYLADLLSLLSMVLPNQVGLVLKYRLDSIDHDYENFNVDVLTKWGIAHVQYICGELSKEYARIQHAQNKSDDGTADEDGNEKDLNDTNDEDEDAKDIGFDDLADTKPLIQPSLSKVASSAAANDASLSALATVPTMNDEENDKKDEKVKETPYKDDKKEEKKEDDSKKKKELTDEEKAKIEEKELAEAKAKPVIHSPVTTATLDEIRTMASRLLPHLFEHGCEIDAVDMLFETDNIKAIIDYVDLQNYNDVLQYVDTSNRYNCTDPIEQQLVNLLLLQIFVKLKQFSYALSVALRIQPYAQQKRTIAYVFFHARTEPRMQLQLAHMLSQATTHIDYLTSDDVQDQDILDDTTHNNDNGPVDFSFLSGLDFPIVTDYHAIEVLQKGHCGVIPQTVLNDIGVTKSRQRNDVCRAGDIGEEAHEWFAVGLANCGTKLLDCVNEAALDENNKSSSTTSGSAQVLLAKGIATGMIHIGDVDEGYSLVDPYLNPTTDGTADSDSQKNKQMQTMIGGIIATALCGAGVNNDFNAGLALLGDYLGEQYPVEVRTVACYALGLCYLGTHNADVRETLVPLLMGEELTAKGKAVCALSLGMVFVGSCDSTLLPLLVATIEEVSESPAAQRMVCVAVALLILNNGFIPNDVSEMLETLGEKSEVVKEYFAVILDMCAHIGTGDVLLIQSLLRNLSTMDKKLADNDAEDDESDNEENDTTGGAPKTGAQPIKTALVPTAGAPTGTKIPSPTDKKDKKVKLSPELVKKQKVQREMTIVTRSLSVLAITFISLCDDLTKQCCQRILYHLSECGSDEIRSTIPLSTALLNISSPTPAITDLLIRQTHDQSPQLATNATLAIGLTAAGSNNSRSLAGVSGMLSESHDKTVTQIGRIAQGLCMLGQGTLTLSTQQFNDSCINSHSIIALILILTQMIETDITTSANLSADFGLCGGKDLWFWSILPVAARSKVMNTVLVNVDEGNDDEPENVQIPVKMGQVQGGVILGRKTVLSGVQVTHAPVVVGVGTYVQVDDDDYTALSHCLEGNVLIYKDKSRME